MRSRSPVERCDCDLEGPNRFERVAEKFEPRRLDRPSPRTHRGYRRARRYSPAALTTSTRDNRGDTALLHRIPAGFVAGRAAAAMLGFEARARHDVLTQRGDGSDDDPRARRAHRSASNVMRALRSEGDRSRRRFRRADVTAPPCCGSLSPRIVREIGERPFRHVRRWNDDDDRAADRAMDPGEQNGRAAAVVSCSAKASPRSAGGAQTIDQFGQRTAARRQRAHERWGERRSGFGHGRLLYHAGRSDSSRRPPQIEIGTLLTRLPKRR